MKWADYRDLVYADLFRIYGRFSLRDFFFEILFGEGFKYCFWLRTCAFAHSSWYLRATLYPFTWFALRHYRYKLGVAIPYQTRIGPGFYIGHFGGIIVNGEATIGSNCNISHGVTIGRLNRGERAGVPQIGSRVYIGPGAKVIGRITIGDDAAIGANCVVTSDVASSEVVVGVPGRVVSTAGSAGYVNNIEYSLRSS